MSIRANFRRARAKPLIEYRFSEETLEILFYFRSRRGWGSGDMFRLCYTVHGIISNFADCSAFIVLATLSGRPALRLYVAVNRCAETRALSVLAE